MTQDWSSEEMAEFVKTIKEICYEVLKEEGVPCYIAAIVQTINKDGTVDVYLPPDTTAILHNKINKTGVVLKPGDSVELCCKKGNLGDAWIAVRHGIDEISATTGGSTGGTNDYNDLINLPSINGAKLIGNRTSTDLGIDGDKTYVHTQTEAATDWTIVHNLNKYPSVTVVNNEFVAKLGEIQYLNLNTVKISFDQAFAGQAFLN